MYIIRIYKKFYTRIRLKGCVHYIYRGCRLSVRAVIDDEPPKRYCFFFFFSTHRIHYVQYFILYRIIRAYYVSRRRLVIVHIRIGGVVHRARGPVRYIQQLFCVTSHTHCAV